MNIFEKARQALGTTPAMKLDLLEMDKALDIANQFLQFLDKEINAESASGSVILHAAELIQKSDVDSPQSRRMTLTESEAATYVDKTPNRCPWCKFELMLRRDFIPTIPGQVISKRFCEECGSNWADTYLLRGVCGINGQSIIDNNPEGIRS